MLKEWLCRGFSLGLLIGFVAGAVGLPLADAVLYHEGPAAQQAFRIHIESSGNPACHAEHCVLGLIASQRQVVGASASADQTCILLSYRPSADSAPLPPRATEIRTIQSRAPPAA